ncbi:MAG: hypothetical protein M1833_004287 [Piccolia ochrophora]|nr:MAG: hypothetical protein M1833_004287 [Piccolia ochrophora]
MSLPYRNVARCCARAVRSSHSSLRSPASALIVHPRQCPSRRHESTSAPVTPAASSNPKISTIVDQISQLTLLETADLVSTLKTRLNIPDMPTFSGSASGTPTTAATTPAEEDDDAPPPAQEKTLFTLKLQSFETGAKPKVIKEVKSMLGLSLVDSKKFVEAAPKVLKDGVPKEEAEKIIETIKALGGVVVME